MRQGVLKRKNKEVPLNDPNPLFGELMERLRRGTASPVSGTVRGVLGPPETRFARFAEDARRQFAERVAALPFVSDVTVRPDGLVEGTVDTEGLRRVE